jgi:hypothetical protein
LDVELVTRLQGLLVDRVNPNRMKKWPRMENSLYDSIKLLERGAQVGKWYFPTSVGFFHRSIRTEERQKRGGLKRNFSVSPIAIDLFIFLSLCAGFFRDGHGLKGQPRGESLFGSSAADAPDHSGVRIGMRNR